MKKDLNEIRLTNQWNNFLLRIIDPYAMAKYEILLAWLGNIKGKKAVVIGSGSGEFAAMLAQAGASVTAVDVSKEIIQLTEETARRLEVSVNTIVAKLEDYIAKDGFDIVAATDVIEHIEDDESATRQLSELVRPGGMILITVPALLFLFGYHDSILGHFRRYGRKDLIRLFDPYFQILKARYFGFSLIPAALVFSKLLYAPYPVGSLKKNRLGPLVGLILSIEKKFSPPAGTSLLLCGIKRDDSAPRPGR